MCFLTVYDTALIFEHFYYVHVSDKLQCKIPKRTNEQEDHSFNI